MRNRPGWRARVVALATAAALAGAGCGGQWRPAQVATTAPPAGKEVRPLEPGTKVRLVLRDGSVVEGTFSSLVSVPFAEYAPAYEADRLRLAATRAVPRLGPGARLLLTDGSRREAELVGFTLPAAVIVAQGDKYRSVVPLTQVAELADGTGLAASGATVADLVARAELPSIQAIALEPREKRAGPAVFPTNLVTQIDAWHGSKTGVAIGFVAVAGLVTVVAVVAIAGGTSSSGGSSCPFVWGFDGQQWRLEAEPFAGSFMELAQRSDHARLEHLRPVDGVYRLRVTNELQEVDHLDQLRLLAVDHAPGARVVPDVYGRLHQVAALTAPVAAHDGLGADVRRWVTEPDGEAWLGNPFLPAHLGPGPVRDALELEFERPPGAGEAVLVARAQSTPFASEVLHSLLSLRGDDLEGWYGRVARDARTLQNLDRLSAESVPSVWSWNGAEWQLAGYLAGLPTRTFATQAVRLDLGRVAGPRLRLRIEGIPGTWRLDSAGVEFAPGAAPRPVELGLRRAQTGQGEDVRALLSGLDGRRHVLARGDVLELDFEGPALAAGLERSLILQATGYYRILIEPRGQPREAQFERLLSEPGALSRHAVELARAQLGVRRLAETRLPR